MLSGARRKLTYCQLLERASIHRQLNNRKYDYSPVKKPCTMPATSEVLSDSEVHIYINNIPPRLRGGYPMVQTTRNTTPNLSLSAPGPLHPVHISNQPSHTVPLTVPVHSGHPLARNVTQVLILHDCATKRRFPTVEELLQLMDTCRPRCWNEVPGQT
jgi:hypothetical protein